MQTSKRQIPIEEAIQIVITQLGKQQYSKSMTKHHKYVYRALRRFSESSHYGLYSPDIGIDFINTVSHRELPLSQARLRIYVNAIRRLDHFMVGDMDWHPPSKLTKEYAHSCFDEFLTEYETYLRNSGKSMPNVRGRMHIVTRFLNFVDLFGIKTLQKLTVPCIYSAFQAVSDKENFRKTVTAFLRYAHRYSLTPYDFSLIVPSVKRHTTIPTVYSTEEVELLLASIDRDLPVGKRNYAIVLIAARLGLRAGDICGLTFENIRYAKCSIELRQSKTVEPLSLPLLPEIREALLDYIENARPDYDCKQIFLEIPHPHTGPLSPNTVSDLKRR